MPKACLLVPKRPKMNIAGLIHGRKQLNLLKWWTFCQLSCCRSSCMESALQAPKSTPFFCVFLINEDLRLVGGLGVQRRWYRTPIYPPPPDITDMPASYVHTAVCFPACAKRNHERRSESLLTRVLTWLTARIDFIRLILITYFWIVSFFFCM